MSTETPADSDFRKEFTVALASFRAERYEDALDGFNKCVDLSDDLTADHDHDIDSGTVYESRAATLEKLERNEEALRDARRVVELCPHDGKGYITAGRLFLKLARLDAALEMCALALERVSDPDPDTLAELSALQAGATARRMAALSSRACHIENLPLELLTMVFLEWKDMDRDGAAPVYASHVNQRWRREAQSTSKLWTRLILGARSPEHKAACWMERSNGRLLELVVRVGFSAVSASSPSIDWLRDLLTTASKTLLVLDLDVDSGTRRSVFDVLRTQSERPLRCLILRSSREKTDDSFERFSLPGHFTCLETIHISDYDLGGSLPCPRLKRLRLHPRVTPQVEASHYITLLRNLPELEELALFSLFLYHPVGPMFQTPLDKPIACLPNLTVLELEGTTMWSDILKAIATPALQTLSISGCYKPRVDDLLALILPHNAPLVNLTITSCVFAEKRLATQLAQFPLLNRLEITRTRDVSDFFVEALAESPAQWPNLEHVNFSACPSVSGGPLRRLVRSRLHKETDTADLQAPRCLSSIKSAIVDGCEQIDTSVVQ